MFLNRMQLLPMSNLTVGLASQDALNQAMSSGLAYNPMWYRATKFFWLAKLTKGKGKEGSQWYPAG